jgi:3-oxoacyl-[acyl-carrier-protein] synthase-3
MAEGYLAARRADYALVVSTEKMSGILDWTDRSTCVLFGDGSGAAVLKRSVDGTGIVSSFHGSDGNLAELLYRPAGGVAMPLDQERLARRDHLMKMSGREIFKNAVRCMADASTRALKAADMTGDDVDLMIPHQANIRIVEATAKYAGIPMEKVFVNLDRYGNMSSASIPVALDEARESGVLEPGMRVLTSTFGAGLTWGAMVWQF